jgi:plastocyanin
MNGLRPRDETRARRGAGCVAAGVCMVCLVAGCFSDRPDPAALPPDAECTVPVHAFGQDRALVVVREFRFLPDTVRVRRGTTVVWSNCEPPAREAHTVTAADASWTSPLLPAGSHYERRFDATGTVDYTCGPHPHMRGVVVVE